MMQDHSNDRTCFTHPRSLLSPKEEYRQSRKDSTSNERSTNTASQRCCTDSWYASRVCTTHTSAHKPLSCQGR